jgi:excisionase family DNA binding protein
MADQRWFDEDEAARYLSLRMSALRRLVKAGRLPSPNVSLGKRMPRWDKEELDRAMTGAAVVVVQKPKTKDPQQVIEDGLQKLLTTGRARSSLRQERRDSR